MNLTVLNDIKRTLFLEGVAKESFAQKIFTLCFAYGLHALIVYRFGQFVRKSFTVWWMVPLYVFCIFIYYCMNYAVEKMYGISISPDADIGAGFYIGHFGGIKVGSGVVIGNNCSVHQQVAIGSATGPSNIIIEDNVWIGGHSTICNGVVIGNNSTIVVGSLVVSSVKPRSMVMGNPARLIKSDFDNSSLMGF